MQQTIADLRDAVREAMAGTSDDPDEEDLKVATIFTLSWTKEER